MSDTCNAMTKQGSQMLICDKPKEPKHAEHEDSTKKKTWTEERWGGGSERTVETWS